MSAGAPHCSRKDISLKLSRRSSDGTLMARPSRPTSNLLTGRAVTWLTVGGLGVLMALFAFMLIGGSVRGTHDAKEVARTGELVQAYLGAQDAMSREDEVEDVYKDDPDPGLHDDFETAARDFQGAMAQLSRSGDVRDRALARRASGLHRRYVAAMRDIFVAAARGDEDLVEQINDERMDPAQDELQPLINGTGPQYATASLNKIDDLRDAERQEFVQRLITVPIGVLLYALLFFIFLAQRRSLDRIARAEVDRLDEAAHTDSLTGLFNHRALQRDLAELEAGVHGMLMLDVVGLKPVNDRDGHLAGDALLQGVAAVLRHEAAGRGRAYRIGGDEFAVVLPRHDETAARDALEAIRVRVSVRHPCGIRGGVSAGGSTATLFERASLALLDARHADGVARVVA